MKLIFGTMVFVAAGLACSSSPIPQTFAPHIPIGAHRLCAKISLRGERTRTSADCSEAWTGYLGCFEKGKSYADSIGGQDISCDGVMLDLASRCWMQQYGAFFKDLWAKKKPQSFSLLLRRRDSEMKSTEWSITVNAGKLSQTPAMPPAPSIEQIFDEIETGLRKSGQTVFAVSNPDNGLPQDAIFIAARKASGDLFLRPTLSHNIDSFKSL